MNSEHNKADPEFPPDSDWKNQTVGSKVYVRGALIGEVVSVRISGPTQSIMLEQVWLDQRGRRRPNPRPITESMDSFLLHNGKVLLKGRDIDAFDRGTYPLLFNFIPNSYPANGTCVRLNEVGKMIYNRNVDAEKREVERGCKFVASAFDHLMESVRSDPTKAAKFRTFVFGAFGPTDTVSSAFQFDVPRQPYVYGRDFHEALQTCFDRFATMGPTFANASNVEFTLRFLHETAEGDDEVHITRMKSGLSGGLYNLTPWTLEPIPLPSQTPLRLIGYRLVLSKFESDLQDD